MNPSIEAPPILECGGLPPLLTAAAQHFLSRRSPISQLSECWRALLLVPLAYAEAIRAPTLVPAMKSAAA